MKEIYSGDQALMVFSRSDGGFQFCRMPYDSDIHRAEFWLQFLDFQDQGLKPKSFTYINRDAQMILADAVARLSDGQKSDLQTLLD